MTSYARHTTYLATRNDARQSVPHGERRRLWTLRFQAQQNKKTGAFRRKLYGRYASKHVSMDIALPSATGVRGPWRAALCRVQAHLCASAVHGPLLKPAKTQAVEQLIPELPHRLTLLPLIILSKPLGKPSYSVAQLSRCLIPKITL